MGRHDRDERFGRTLRELLLKDVRERVGDDSDEDSQGCEHVLQCGRIADQLTTAMWIGGAWGSAALVATRKRSPSGNVT
jgi:hypothetical protein